MNNNASVKEICNQIDQRDMALVGTRDAIDTLRIAKAKGHPQELIEALFQLARGTAVMEWGPGTEVDDFSEPGFFIVSNGKKSKRL